MISDSRGTHPENRPQGFPDRFPARGPKRGDGALMRLENRSGGSQPETDGKPADPTPKAIFGMGSRFVGDIAVRWFDHDMTTYSAALAFYGIFSIAPILFIIVSVGTAVFGNAAAAGSLVTILSKIIGPFPAEVIQEMMADSYRTGGSVTASVVGALILCVSATNLFAHLRKSLDIMGNVSKERTGFAELFHDHVWAFMLTVATGFLLAIFSFSTAALSGLGSYLTRFAPPLWILNFLNVATSLVVATILFAALYRYIPSRRLSWRHAFIGATIIAVLFTAGEYALSLVFSYGLIATSYGVAGAIIALLFWVYYSSIIFLLGAEISIMYVERSDLRQIEKATELAEEEKEEMA